MPVASAAAADEYVTSDETMLNARHAGGDGSNNERDKNIKRGVIEGKKK